MHTVLVQIKLSGINRTCCRAVIRMLTTVWITVGHRTFARKRLLRRRKVFTMYVHTLRNGT